MPFGKIKKINNDFFDINFLEFNKDQNIKNDIHYLYWENCKIRLKGFKGEMKIYFPHIHKFYSFFYECVEWDEFQFDYRGKIAILFFEGTDFSIYIKNEIKIYNYYCIDKQLLDLNIDEFMISQDLIHLRNKIKNSYGLEYYSNSSNCLIFGIYRNIDLILLKKIKNPTILWGGSDIMLNSKLRDYAINYINSNNICNIAMSEYIENKLLELGVKKIIRINISFCWNNIDYFRIKNTYYKKNSIYVYDGMDKKKIKNWIYNQEIVNKLVKKMEQFNWIRSSDGYIEDIINEYNNCFLSLRLTNYDGNANSAQECGMLEIPVISNQNMNNCISWSNLEEIEYKIKYIYENNINIKWEKNGVNLLFISNDIPGNGGGATYTEKLVNYLKKRGFNLFELYLINSKKSNLKKEGKNSYILYFDHNKIWDLNGWIEKIAEDDKSFSDFKKEGFKICLRSAIGKTDIEILNKKYKIFFFCPGVFKNNLNNEWEVIENIEKYINAGNIKNSKALNTFVNSQLTHNIFSKFGLKNIKKLEINLLQLDDINTNEKRDIDVLFVVSNINRKIKNIELFLSLSNKIKAKFMLISYEEVPNKIISKYKNIEFVFKVNNSKISDYYKRSKILLNTSYFDSMSNVVLEGINNGCHILVSKNNGIVDYLNNDCFTVSTYKEDDWIKKIILLIENWKNFNTERKDLIDNLNKIKWEVEIELLSIFSNK